MNGILALIMLGAVAVVPAEPTLDSIEPDVLALGGTVQVMGTNFIVDQTTVSVGGQAQNVVFVEESKAVFVVSQATELGMQTLVLTTPYGQAQMDVEVVPSPPQLGQITPDPIVLGKLVNVQGSDLSTVAEVTMGGLPCEITALTDNVLVFIAPLDGSLIGNSLLKISGEAGYDVQEVMGEAPTPIIDQMAPNPIRAGDLLTITGAILDWNTSAEVAGLEAPVVHVSPGKLIVQVPPGAPVGPKNVKVLVGATPSEPTGPLHITAADPERPRVTAVYPSSVSRGGRFWITGEYLDAIDDVAHGLQIESCDKRQCALSSEGLEVGSITLSVSSPAGTAVFGLNVEEEGAVEPSLLEAAPWPAFRGEELTITGTDLFEVSAVVISGQAQAIDFVDSTQVRVTVHEETPLGGETLFVAGSSGSNALSVIILESFDPPEPDAGTVEGGGDASSGGDAGPTADGGTAGPPSGGCQSIEDRGAPWPMAFFFLVLYAFFRTSRNSRFPLGPAMGDSTAPTSEKPRARAS